MNRTNFCGEITSAEETKEVVLCGWVDRIRDHGSLVFVDLRDYTGKVQLVFDPDIEQTLPDKAHQLHSEYVIEVKGTVRKRSPQTINPNLKTGEIEVEVREIKLINKSRPSPFVIGRDNEINEEIRLKYRYLDLRRPFMQRNIMFRSKVMQATREYFTKNKFFEVETPFLTKSTPEGARDYLVPSRVHPGNFFALPQSPQLFKQILMISGYDRYFQIVKCFRDEDLRADRQPEFTQIDVEMSFIDENDIISIIEKLLYELYKQCLGEEIPIPFIRMDYEEAMLKYGTDRPDLRYTLEINDITDILQSTEFKIFRSALENKCCIRGINIDNGCCLSRKEIDELIEYAKKLGAGGMAYFKASADGLNSNITKFFKENELTAIKEKFNAKENDLIVLIAEQEELACKVLSEIRTAIAKKLNMIDENKKSFLWVVNFPLFELDDKQNLTSKHHPFTSPDRKITSMEKDFLLSLKSRAYDVVLNGIEIGGGSIRIHDNETQSKIFEILNITEEDAKIKFGFLLDALQYGAPIHGGIALGLDRLIMLMLKLDSIRDVIPFPKTQKAVCLMTEAPSQVADEQLKELGLKIDLEDK